MLRTDKMLQSFPCWWLRALKLCLIFVSRMWNPRKGWKTRKTWKETAEDSLESALHVHCNHFYKSCEFISRRFATTSNPFSPGQETARRTGCSWTKTSWEQHSFSYVHTRHISSGIAALCGQRLMKTTILLHFIT